MMRSSAQEMVDTGELKTKQKLWRKGKSDKKNKKIQIKDCRKEGRKT